MNSKSEHLLRMTFSQTKRGVPCVICDGTLKCNKAKIRKCVQTLPMTMNRDAVGVERRGQPIRKLHMQISENGLHLGSNSLRGSRQDERRKCFYFYTLINEDSGVK